MTPNEIAIVSRDGGTEIELKGNTASTQCEMKEIHQPKPKSSKWNTPIQTTQRQKKFKDQQHELDRKAKAALIASQCFIRSVNDKSRKPIRRIHNRVVKKKLHAFRSKSKSRH